MLIADKSHISQNASILKHLDQISTALLEASEVAEKQEAIDNVLEHMSSLEDKQPVSILEFIDSDRYLDLGDWVFPAGKWIADTFYHPDRHFEDMHLVWKNRWGGDREFVFPGFESLGYSLEDVENFHFNELVLIIGQRSIKSVISAVITLYELYKLLCLPSVSAQFPGVMPRTPVHISVGATAQKQADETVWSYIDTWFDYSPWFRKYTERLKSFESHAKQELVRRTASLIGFEHKKLYIDAVHSRSGGLRGSTRKAIVNDEISHFDDGEKRSADAVYDAMSNSTETFGEHGIKVNISSPLHVSDKGMRLLAACGIKFRSTFYDEFEFRYLEEFNGEKIEPSMNMLGFHFPTWEINPTKTFASFAPRLNANKESTLRDFGALPSQAQEQFFSDTTKIGMMFNPSVPCPVDDKGVVSDDFRPKGGIAGYHLHVDVGEGKPSNFGIALGHAEFRYDSDTGQRRPFIVIDLAYAVTARIDGEVDYQKAREILDIIIDRFPIAHYSSDRWNDIEYMQKIRRKVKSAEKLTLELDHYNNLKTLIYEQQITCHTSNLGAFCKASPEEELKRLGLVNGRKIEKGLGYTKDIADCIAAVSFKGLNKVTRKLASGRLTSGVFGRAGF